MKKILYSFVCMLAVSAAFTSCQKEPTADGEVGLKSISIERDVNTTLREDIKGTIDESAHTVTLVVPESLVGKSIITTFTVTKNDEVTFDGTPITTNVTGFVLANGTKIVVSDTLSGLTVEYTLILIGNDSRAELLSIVFTAADNDLLAEDVAADAIADEMIVRVPGAAFQKTLKLTATAGSNDEIKINGEVAADGTATVDTQFPIDIVVSDAIAGTTKSYVLKVGKVLELVLTHLGTHKEGTMATDVQMEINPKDNTPYLVYVRKVDGDTNNSASVVKWTGSAFELVGKSGFTPQTKAASRATMTFDANGTPYVKYVGGEVSGKNSVRKFNGTEWELVGPASYGTVNTNTSYLYPIVFEPGATYPTVFFCGNTKSVATYRNVSSARFNGTDWDVAPVSALPAYGSGSTASSGMFYISQIASYGEKKYMVSALNEFGFYVSELAGNGVITNIVENYVPSGEKCGLPGNVGIACDKDGEIYIFEGIWSANLMQVYKVDKANKTVATYGKGIPVTISSYGTVTEDAAFGINPVTNQMVVAMDGESAPKFLALNENLEWDTIKSDFAVAAKSGYVVRHTADGKCYVAVSTANGIELFSIDLEADVLPE